MAQRGARVALLSKIGACPGLVAHLVRDEGVAGSNPATPTAQLNLHPVSPPVGTLASPCSMPELCE
jgi:hypothetical protein